MLAKPFQTLLVSTRAEIACRVVRSAKRLGLRTVAVYSDADRNALHVRAADTARHIGEAPPSQSYLHFDRILRAAEDSGAEAVHPGYGFLSENPAFAEACNNRGLIFVGPPAHVIRSMGSKSSARALVQAAGVPVVPGYHEDDQSLEALRAAADDIGYPVMVKPVMGGGGKGMHIARSSDDIDRALRAAKLEAAGAFGDDSLLLERYIPKSRHVEVQVFGDTHGNVVHLYERDCSVQRRHQKILEEAPAPLLDDNMRARMHEAALATARAVNYVGAGTVEFIVDLSSDSAGNDFPFYFLEMNTRLQVEHPVTEAITGVDLVEWQLRAAAGESIPVSSQADVPCNGSAIEARIYSEAPESGFLPQTGQIKEMAFEASPAPPHLGSTSLRVDSGFEAPRDEVSIHYDPLLAKAIAHGPTRESARQRLGHALATSVVFGVQTNAAFCVRILNHPEFVHGGSDTGILSRHEAELVRPESEHRESAAIAALGLHELAVRNLTTTAPKAVSQNTRGLAGFRVNAPARTTFCISEGSGPRNWGVELLRNQDLFTCRVLCRDGENDDAEDLCVKVLDSEIATEQVRAVTMNLVYYPSENREQVKVVVSERDVIVMRSQFDKYPGDLNARVQFETASVDADSQAKHLGNELVARSPMPGKIVACYVEVGDEVEVGMTLFEVEAMKMMHAVKAQRQGVVSAKRIAVGDVVDTHKVLLELKSKE